MLLRELAEQSRRRGANASPGFQRRPVAWEVELDSHTTTGHLVRLDGDKGTTMLVPDIQRSGSAPKPFIVADKAGMVFAVPKPLSKTASPDQHAAAVAKAAACQHAYIQRLQACVRDTGEPHVEAIRAWLQAGHPGVSAQDLDKVGEPQRVCFRVAGSTTRVHEYPNVQAWWATYTSHTKAGSAGIAPCLVCGTSAPVAETFPLQLRAGSLSSEQVGVISVNEDAFGRQSTQQLSASPICLECAQASVEGLQSLLDTQARDHSGPRHTVKLDDDRRVVFWLSEDQGFDLVDLLTETGPQEVADLLRAPDSGARHTTDAALGDVTAVTLSANKARMVIHAYARAGLEQVRDNVRDWFGDTHLPPAWHAGDPLARAGYQRLWQIEKALVRESAKTGAPGAGQALWNAALFAAPLPRHLLTRAVDRERSEAVDIHAQDGTRRRTARRRSAARMALIQVMCTRNPGGAVSTTDDTSATARTLGHLFALLEDIQYTALGQINAPIANKWLARASTNPVAAYPSLLRSAESHLAKLRKNNPGAAYRLSTDLATIHASLPQSGLPPVLPLDAQAHWFLGLHAQRAAQHAAREAGAAAKRERQATSPATEQDPDTTAERND